MRPPPAILGILPILMGFRVISLMVPHNPGRDVRVQASPPDVPPSCKPHMVGCQDDDQFFRSLRKYAPENYGTPKRDHTVDTPPYPSQSRAHVACSALQEQTVFGQESGILNPKP